MGQDHQHGSGALDFAAIEQAVSNLAAHMREITAVDVRLEQAQRVYMAALDDRQVMHGIRAELRARIARLVPARGTGTISHTYASVQEEATVRFAQGLAAAYHAGRSRAERGV